MLTNQPSLEVKKTPVCGVEERGRSVTASWISYPCARSRTESGSEKMAASPSALVRM